MGTKNNPGSYDCYAAADPDEPIFTLRAKDPMAPSLVRSWAQTRQQQVEMGLKPVEDLAKVNEARQCATDMEAWRAAKLNAELEAQNGITAAMRMPPSRRPPDPTQVATDEPAQGEPLPSAEPTP